ncbi:hypothetical protein BJ742DRAFT_835059 [Cladochytrium replicatum]|nr:hypothetical protein BJ742DRAFT_835059 [Cladochytrium replicatum]
MVSPLSFWGLVLEPNKSYSQVVESDFRISMATLAKKGNSTKPVIVQVTVEDSTFNLCTLQSGHRENQPLEIYFSEGEEISLQAVGDAAVHLTGFHYVDTALMDGTRQFRAFNKLITHNTGNDDMDDEEGEEDDEDEEGAEYDEALLAKLANGEAMEEDDDDEDDDEEEEELAPKAGSKRKNGEKEPPAKKAKLESAIAAVKQDVPKEQKQKQDKKQDKKEQQAAKESPKKEGDNLRTLPSGLVIEDVETGNGPKAKKGSTVAVRYIGKLSNGKVFDSNVKGQPLSFTVGKGEVIKGWDVGLDGMTVGSKRKLTIPPALAYGSRGAPPEIPPNSTLHFEVKLLSVKKK